MYSTYDEKKQGCFRILCFFYGDMLWHNVLFLFRLDVFGLWCIIIAGKLHQSLFRSSPRLIFLAVLVHICVRMAIKFHQSLFRSSQAWTQSNLTSESTSLKKKKWLIVFNYHYLSLFHCLWVREETFAPLTINESPPALFQHSLLWRNWINHVCSTWIGCLIRKKCASKHTSYIYMLGCNFSMSVI